MSIQNGPDQYNKRLLDFEFLLRANSHESYVNSSSTSSMNFRVPRRVSAQKQQEATAHMIETLNVVQNQTSLVACARYFGELQGVSKATVMDISGTGIWPFILMIKMANELTHATEIKDSH